MYHERSGNVSSGMNGWNARGTKATWKGQPTSRKRWCSMPASVMHSVVWAHPDVKIRKHRLVEWAGHNIAERLMRSSELDNHGARRIKESPSRDDVKEPSSKLTTALHFPTSALG